MDGKNDFLIKKCTWNLHVIKTHLNFGYVVDAFITLNLKARYKYTSPFSSMLLVRVHLFLSINLSYIGGLIS